MESLLLFVFGVLLVTLVGHWLWLIFAKVFAGLGVRERSAREEPPDRCRNCRELIPFHARRCPGCGLTRSAGDEAADLRIVSRQLDSFRNAGEIDGDTYWRMTDTINARKRKLRGDGEPRHRAESRDRDDGRPRLRHEPQFEQREQTPRREESPPAPAPEATPQSQPPIEFPPMPPLPAETPNVVATPHETEHARDAVRPPEPEILREPPRPAISPPSRPPEPERMHEPLRPAIVPPSRPPEPERIHEPARPAIVPPPRLSEPERLREPLRPAPVPPDKPRVSWGEWLGAFLEQRNIFWGELIGGLLIVGCSIALILSLWQTLESIPLFPFLAAALVTFGLFGAGRYSLTHWKLESSSRGLLVIATLLVPLNFLVLAGISSRSNDSIEITAKILAFLAFATMVRSAGRLLLPDPVGVPSRTRGWLLSLAVVGPALTPMLAARVYDPAESQWPFALLVMSTTSFLVMAVAGTVVAYWRAQVVGLAARPILGWVGFSSYSLAVALAFLAFWVGAQGASAAVVLRPLAGPAVVVGASILAAGLFVQRRMSAEPNQEHGGAHGVIATGVALLGGLVQVAAFGMAWPDRGALLFAGLANYAILTTVALRLRFPPAHLLALPSLLIGLLAGMSVVAGADAPLGSNAGLTGTSLAGLVIVLAFVADRLIVANRADDARAYQIAAGIGAVLSLALAAADSLSDPQWATCVGGTFAAVCIVLSRRWALPVLAEIGVALVSLTSVAALHWGAPGQYPAWGFLLAAEALIFSAARRSWWRPAMYSAILAGVAIAVGRGEFTSTWNCGTALLLAVTAFVQAGRWRLMQLTWIGAVILLVATAHALILSAGVALLLPWATVLLVFGSATLLASLIALKPSHFPLRDIYATPLRWSGLAATVFAAAFLLGGIDEALLGPLTLYALWLGALWLIAALSEREARWFIAFQVATTTAVGFSVGWMLRTEAMAESVAVSFASASAFYRFGLGLGGIALIWAFLRRALERRPFFRTFYSPANIFDAVLVGVLIIGQLILAGWLVIPEVVREVAAAGAIDLSLFRPEAVVELEFHPWLLLGLLGAALALFVRLKDRERAAALRAGLICLAISAPLLAAGRQATQIASASSLRWWLSASCLMVGSLVWLRQRRAEDAATTSWGALPSLIVAAPAIFLSAFSAAIILSGGMSAGPAAGSFFARVDWSLSHGLPVFIIALTLLGHALRERIAGYALAAGLLLTVATGLGCAVENLLGGLQSYPLILAESLQRATTVGAVISIAWIVAVIVSRRRSGQTLEDWPSLWPAQMSIALIGNVLLLGWTVMQIALSIPAASGPTVPATYADVPTAIGAIAGVWGWIAFVLAAGAGALGCAFTRRRIPIAATALSCLGVLALIAAAIAVSSPDWAFRTIMYGTAAFAFASALASRRSDAFDRYVAIAGGAAFALAGKAIFIHGDSLAAIPALAITSIAGMRLSIRRQRPEWACLAGACVQLTVAAALWHGFRPESLLDWSAYLVQAIVIAASILMLIGFRLLKRDAVGANVFTQMQQAIVAVGLIVLFAIPAVQLVLDPEALPALFAGQTGTVSGLAALLAAALAIAEYARREARHLLGDVAAAGASIAAIWLALAASAFWPGWPVYRILLGAFAALAAGALILKGPRAEVWSRVYALALTGLALRIAWIDPLRPYFSAFAAVLAAAVFAVHAVRRNRLGDVWASSGLFCLAGLFVWVKWGTATLPHLVATEAAFLAGAAILWHAIARQFSTPFRDSAVAITASMIGFLAIWGIVDATGASERLVPNDAAWIGAAVAIAAALTGLLKPALRSAAPSLYGLALCLTLFGLLQPHWTMEEMVRPAILALAGFVFIAQLVEWFAMRRDQREAASWLFSAQLAIAGLIVLLSFSACLGTASTVDRLSGSAALILLAPAMALLARRNIEPAARALENAVVGLIVLIGAEFGWSMIATDAAGAWLRGSVALLAALCLVALASALLVPRFATADGRLGKAARRAGPVLGLLGIGVLALVLVQEFWYFDRAAGGLPMTVFEAIVVTAAMIALIASALAFAIRPGLDPLGLSVSGRKGYVYAAEAVLALLFLHFRLCNPELHPPPVGSLRWAFTLMLIAFAGIGLAEFFRRRNMEVLADPIHRTGAFLPLLPLIAFWLAPASKGASPSFESYSLLWVTAGLLYGVLAMMRRSYRYVLATALAMNAALWALYAHEGIGFLVHPQVWLVPLALIVLVSEYFHRDRLTKELASGLRYGGLVMLYLSSLADVFVAGPSESAPLLLVLAALSVIGVFAGILLRVRAYLFLGSGFLALVVFRMIWHAAVEREQTWVWWACGILLGVLVLMLFAVLERRGQKVRDALERFRQWR